jgi:hypothetical protein
MKPALSSARPEWKGNGPKLRQHRNHGSEEKASD